MAKLLQARSLQILDRQKIKVPIYTHFLDVHLDIRHNNCLLWTLTDPEDSVKESDKEGVTIIMLKLGDALEPVNAKYIGNFKDNSGARHVFVIRDSEVLPFGAPAK